MTLPLLVWRSLRQHALTTIVTALSLSLACGLVMTVWVVKTESERAFSSSTSGFDAVLGARGSKLQLVLSSLFYLEASPGNVSGEDYATIKANPLVASAVPIAMGDNYQGWRIIGTTPERFTVENLEVAEGGRLFAEGALEAVVGSLVADRLGLKVGDTFHPSHGLSDSGEGHAHEEEYTIVGRLEVSNTPADRVIWIPLEGLQTMGGHAASAAEEVSAVLLKFRSPMAGFRLDSAINRRDTRMTLAYPVGAVVADLFTRFAWVSRVLEMVAYLVAVVAVGSVLAGIHASLASRRRDIAILRSLGARRRTVCGVIVAEAGAIGALGAVLGLVVYAGLAVGAAWVVRTQTGVVIDVTAWNPVLAVAPLGMVVLALLGGIVPAVSAYRTPVADNLLPVS